VGYKLLKWAHATRPEALAQIYTDCLEAGIHPWRQVTVVAINKPFKPDYSKPKAYRPISLMECAGKLLEKIVAKRINDDIQTHDLLPMTQFGSRPYHSAVDAAAVLVHRIQATRAAKRAGALLLFDISGFFDNINPTRATQIFRDKGFPPGMCAWVASFLSARTATLRGGGHVSDPFEITSGTPQGSPLSPILSAMYTANLLEMTSTWSLRDLTMYVDDGAIYATSATVKGATESAAEGYAQVLNWLYRNGLTADPEKCELMTFTHSRADPKKTGQPVLGINYTDPIHGPQHIGVAKEPIRYLGLYIDPKLNWQHHVQIMANRGRSTIRGINILGNSVRGIDILSWRRVYNALVVPVMTYGVPVWYTGIRQKKHMKLLQTAQYEGIRKLLGVFKTTPLEPLHNLTGIPPISYLLDKLLTAYTRRLRAMPPNALVCTVLETDRCRIWPEYTNPHTNLYLASVNIGAPTYRPIGPCTVGTWTHPRLLYNPEPSDSATRHYREVLIHPAPSDTYIFCFHLTHNGLHFGCYLTYQQRHIIHSGCARGIDQMQATSRAVKMALRKAFESQLGPIILWLRPKLSIDRLLTLSPHRDTHITYDTRLLIAQYLDNDVTTSLSLCTYHPTWPGAPTPKDRSVLNPLVDGEAIGPTPLTDVPPKEVMWRRIRADYTPSDHPSTIACVPPQGNKLPPAMLAAVSCKDRIISCTIPRLITNHYFGADYSIRFRPNAGDNLYCPCEHRPRRRGRRLHTKHHVLFDCENTLPFQLKHLRRHNLTTWESLFTTEEATAHLCDFLRDSNSTLLRPLPATQVIEPEGPP
jgi:hypothetical protein